MNLEYGLGYVNLIDIIEPEIITINYVGGFYLFDPNNNFTFVRKRNKIILRPKKTKTTISNNLLFRYIGSIKILNCKVGKKSAKIVQNNIDRFDKISSTWDTMNLEWHDYLMDEKINTESKRQKQKVFIKNELQQLFKT
tara:strand:+ start:114 stop:530 length:417 start_codon:yes stop_codon:yes gene_type:complete